MSDTLPRMQIAVAQHGAWVGYVLEVWHIRNSYQAICQTSSVPDVAQVFPNDAAVNQALRLLIQVAQHQQPNAMAQGAE